MLNVFSKLAFGEHYVDHMTDRKFWDNVVERYLNNSCIKNQQLSSTEDYHFGPWLKYIDRNSYDEMRIVQLRNLSKALADLDIQNSGHVANKGSGSQFNIDSVTWSAIYEQFKTAVDNSVMNEYKVALLERDLIAYTRLLEKEHYDSNR